MRRGHRADDRPRAEAGEERAVAGRARPKDVARDDGQVGDEREAEERADRAEERETREERGRATRGAGRRAGSPPGVSLGVGDGGTWIRHRATRTARKLTALTAKQAPVPTRARRSPATAGPIARERLNWSELRATAFGICRGGTRLVSTDW